MPRFLDVEELDLLAIGAWILGTGGGGSPYASHLVARQFYEDGGRIALLDPDVPIAYLPGNARRVRVRVVGEIARLAAKGASF